MSSVLVAKISAVRFWNGQRWHSKDWLVDPAGKRLNSVDPQEPWKCEKGATIHLALSAVNVTDRKRFARIQIKCNGKLVGEHRQEIDVKEHINGSQYNLTAPTGSNLTVDFVALSDAGGESDKETVLIQVQGLDSGGSGGGSGGGGNNGGGGGGGMQIPDEMSMLEKLKLFFIWRWDKEHIAFVAVLALILLAGMFYAKQRGLLHVR